MQRNGIAGQYFFTIRQIPAVSGRQFSLNNTLKILIFYLKNLPIHQDRYTRKFMIQLPHWLCAAPRGMERLRLMVFAPRGARHLGGRRLNAYR
ncbi:hypothetical protein KL86DPRO_50327 [uncultured delta proteobacterium]|uniref:Uncharacterized protein n=1 Tax=uncultured delta proteobacterium TaxID=34034 RepID=A0A212KE96_9DELT|nr:hypothetical protein KL86DPRO_50327 [uncultured delta proteobacterium]